MANTGAIITAVGTVFAAIATVLVGYYVRRVDRVAKLSQSNLQDQSYILKLVGALRDDYWALADWSYAARAKGVRYEAVLNAYGHYNEVTEIGPFGQIPEPRHRTLEAKQARGEPINDD